MTQILLYAKQNCGLCHSAEQKLKLMNLPHEVRSLEQVSEPHEGWRDDGSVEAQAASALLGQPVPMLSVGGEWLTYPGAMKKLKGNG